MGMTLRQAFGASYSIRVGGVEYTIAPLTTKDRLRIESWYVNEKLRAVQGDLKYSALANMPEATRGDVIAKLMLSPTSFSDAMRTERGRAFALYVAVTKTSPGTPTAPAIDFDSFCDSLEERWKDELELVAYWIAKSDFPLDDDCPLVLARKNTSTPTTPLAEV